MGSIVFTPPLLRFQLTRPLFKSFERYQFIGRILGVLPGLLPRSHSLSSTLLSIVSFNAPCKSKLIKRFFFLSHPSGCVSIALSSTFHHKLGSIGITAFFQTARIPCFFVTDIGKCPKSIPFAINSSLQPFGHRTRPPIKLRPWIAEPCIPVRSYLSSKEGPRGYEWVRRDAHGSWGTAVIGLGVSFRATVKVLISGDL